MALYNALLSNYHLPCSIFFFFILTTLLNLPSTTNSISFTFPSSPNNDPKIHVQGDSFLAGNAIQLTKNATGNGSVGRATYSEPIQIWDPSTGRVADFSTRFSLVIETVNNTEFGGHGDGVTFFLAPFRSEVSPMFGGGFLGLMSSGAADQESQEYQFVAVELDTYKNEWDPCSSHVGVNVNSVVSVDTKAFQNGSMRNGKHVINAWVSYNSTTKKLSASLTSAENPVIGRNSTLSRRIDLSKYLPETVRVGFSAASTGMTLDNHKILSWQFNSTFRKGNGVNSLVVGLIVGLDAFGCSIGFAIFIWWSIKRRRARNSHLDAANSDSSMDDAFEKGTGPKRFLYSELVDATNNFHEAGKLGEGGFGGVYRGFLSGANLNIAVKRISKGSQQGRREYQSEVRIISKLRHRNLVQLIGWSHQRNELLLVYEFMPNRSLDKHLFRGVNVLNWEVRYKIALGLASALLYLHELWEQCVLHRDIKASNVMLDSDFNAKLGDFGLARLVDHHLGSQTTALAGTLGYLAPECIYTSKSSKESDVYSFGIVALEIACGRKPVEQNKENLVDWVWELYANGKIVEAADERLNMDFDGQQMERLLILGLWCAHPDPTTRPSIRQVMNLLNHESPLVNLPTKLPPPAYNYAYAPRLDMCKLAFASACGDYSNSQTNGSQCRCSKCSTADSSQMLTKTTAGSSPSESPLHSC
ncbi:L-type lectin-domain containing receptor kinase IX.1-like [Papaver somniferum]|uniref:L-type lectin-domain containing receptor kinase IX.1-like n=1 Tax=Papaver somniferum TaxID=3469 RepID=UPI000E703749|nr:L-type lectin-domain containing receptor kinase IX.1-like [Papaver somniferum]